jgi:hypothetical protein
MFGIIQQSLDNISILCHLKLTVFFQIEDYT